MKCQICGETGKSVCVWFANKLEGVCRPRLVVCLDCRELYKEKVEELRKEFFKKYEMEND